MNNIHTQEHDGVQKIIDDLPETGMKKRSYKELMKAQEANERMQKAYERLFERQQEFSAFSSK
jgi:hypothetical protein